MASEKNYGPAHEYLRDAWQRSILFLDILRQRGNIFREQQEKTAPHVLEFEADLIMDGRKLERPVNYGLVKIVPPPGTVTDESSRPFVVVDPRAGHGPGIGGMKKDSEIGVALANGHPCYFIGFLPEPMPEQTIEDVWNAEAAFIEEVARRHPSSEKPAVIANCQAGWQTSIMAATHPDVPGPLLLVGAPLSYWAGVRGKNPMRYTGGMLGGSWLTALSGDLGGGKFDGANLVANFEKLDPANTYLDKPYNLYANVDTETERFLDFETWWGSPVLMNADEIQWIVDNLFVGNRLTSGDLQTSEGVRIDLRNIQSPIVCFCSWGDNITPPQQALGWITDLYQDDADLISSGQTIIYSLHQSIGHLGIFVSGKIATKEHSEFASCIDMIELMPPGLYEAVMEDVDGKTANRDLVEGQYVFRLVPRTLDELKAIIGNRPEDDLKFAAVDRISSINRQIYETYAAPLIRAMTPAAYGEWARKLHPNRLRFAIFSDENPMMRGITEAAEQVRRERQPVPQDNMFIEAEKATVKQLGAAISAFGKASDQITEQLFHLTYGSPLVQVLAGLDPKAKPAKRKIEREAPREQARAKKRKSLEGKFDQGGAVEAALRSIAYIRSAEGAGADERGFAVLKDLHDAQPPGRPRSMSELKQTLREQYLLLRLDEKRAMEAIPKLLPANAEERASTLRAVQRLAFASGEPAGEAKRRLGRIEKLFAAGPTKRAPKRRTRTAAADA
jgi:pimeloyl-ACP methyl ester carboxylesterase